MYGELVGGWLAMLHLLFRRYSKQGVNSQGKHVVELHKTTDVADGYNTWQ
jgi:hypothetical protein